MRCDACSETAIVDQPYVGRHVCGDHLRASVRERVRRELHRQLPQFRGGTIAVALSGGKDSSAALALMVEQFGGRPNVRFVAISVNEGIAGYRDRTLEAAKGFCDRLGVEHRVVGHGSAYGFTTDEAARRLPTIAPCSFCGVWRRQLLNRTAREIDASVLVLGFNLDDLAQTVLMNFARADLGRLVRMAPHARRQPGLIPRIAPLARVPEREVFLFAQLEGLPFDHGECPHAARAARNVFREAVWRLEEAIPGTRQALLRSQAAVARALFPEGEPGTPLACLSCGEPATGGRCRACDYRTAAETTLMAPATTGSP